MALKLMPPPAVNRQSRRRETQRLVRRIIERPAALDRFGAALALVPPGRKGSRFWYVRGRLAGGRHIEASSKSTRKNRTAPVPLL